MNKEIRLNIVLIVTTIILGVCLVYLKNRSNIGKIISPFSFDRGIFSFFGIKEKPKKIIYGYLPWWTLHTIDELQLDKLTDIAYFGLHITEDGDFVKSLEDGSLEPGYNNWVENEELNNLIEESKKNGVRFAITVISHYDDVSDKFLDCEPCWENFAKNLYSEMTKRGIEHINLNFEYAGPTEIETAKKYSKFVEFLNQEMEKMVGDSFVTVASFADSVYKPRVTSDLNALGKAADAVFIMAYDFHRPASDNAGPVSPIEQPGFDLTGMVEEYLSHMSPNKIIMGVPYYGYNWVVENEEPRSKRIEGSDENGFSESQTYSDILDLIEELEIEVQWDEHAKTPYFNYISPETESIRQVWFENEESLKHKYQLIKFNDLAGVGIWALGYDEGNNDFWNLLYSEFIH